MLPANALSGFLGVLAMTAVAAHAAPPPLLSILPSERSGVAFAHRSGPSLLFTPEVIGPGVALPDIDGDGRPDLYLVNGADVAPDGSLATRHPDRLYRNAGGRFEDVTTASGVAGAGIGNGVTAADLDNDGYADLVLTGYQEARLLKNNGDGTFTDAHPGRSLAPLLFYAGSSAADVDRDGFLDLYIAHYLQFDYRGAPRASVAAARDRAVLPSLGPLTFSAGENTLLHARGDGHFDDLTLEAGVGDNEQGGSRSLGTLFADLDRDGWPELLVANDQSPFGAYRTRGDLRFESISQSAYLKDTRGNMGIACGDHDGDGWPDLFISHFDHEHNGFYRNVGKRLRFQDASLRVGLTVTDWDVVGWGTAFVDLDTDGWSDLVVANGHLFPPGLAVDAPLPARIAPIPQKPQVYRNRSGRDFEAIGAHAIAPATPELQGRGLAVGDLDGDGYPDLVIAANNGPPLILLNAGTARGATATLELCGTASNRDAVGARVETVCAGAAGRPAIVSRERRAGNGYLSTDAAPLQLGLGSTTGTLSVRVIWPSGQWRDVEVPVGGRLRVVE